jgi:hypothetical protein
MFAASSYPEERQGSGSDDSIIAAWRAARPAKSDT